MPRLTGGGLNLLVLVVHSWKVDLQIFAFQYPSLHAQTLQLARSLFGFPRTALLKSISFRILDSDQSSSLTPISLNLRPVHSIVLTAVLDSHEEYSSLVALVDIVVLTPYWFLGARSSIKLFDSRYIEFLCCGGEGVYTCQLYKRRNSDWCQGW